MSTSAVFSSLTSDWWIENVGNYDGGAAADILLRNTTNGAVVLWSMNSLTVAGSQVQSALSQDWWVM